MLGRLGITTLLLAAAVLSTGALKGARVSVSAAEAPAIRSVTGLDYGSFLEAVAFWDVEAAYRMGTRDDQRAYVDALRALLLGDEAAAIERLVAMRASSSDETLQQLAASLLEQLYFADDRWDAFRTVRNRESSDDPFVVLLEALAGGPQPKLTVPDETVVLTTPDAGLPTLRVAVNGKPFDFILDTGAPFTVINDDVARAAGIEPVGQRMGVIRNEIRGRPARIERLELGGVVAEHHPVMIVPTTGMTIAERPSENKTIQGILGWPLIRKLDLEIELAGGRTTIRNPGPRENDERNLFFCFRPMVVAHDGKGMPLHFLLDTGTDGTTLFRRIGKKTELGKVKEITIGTSRIGETTRDDEGRMLPRFTIFLGDHRVRFEKIPLFPGSQVDGVLGTDVHAGGRVRIDYAGGRYSLSP